MNKENEVNGENEVNAENEENERNENSEYNEIKNNSFMYKEKNYILKQNENLIKTSQYNYIDYQYMVQEIVKKETKTYYGRINRLKFKLCYEYCEACYELGTSEDDQKCLSCLPEYQYDYLFYIGQNINNKELQTCVPENYYYNGNTLVQ